MGAWLSPGQLSREVEINAADKLVARSLGNGAVDCAVCGRLPFLCIYQNNLQTWTLHRALSLSSEFPVARGNIALGADACLSCRCDVSLGDCSHIEAQSGCARGRRGALRHHATAIRGQTQPARVRYPAESLNSLPTIAFRIDMADRRFGDHDCDLPCT